MGAVLPVLELEVLRVVFPKLELSLVGAVLPVLELEVCRVVLPELELSLVGAVLPGQELEVRRVVLPELELGLVVVVVIYFRTSTRTSYNIIGSLRASVVKYSINS